MAVSKRSAGKPANPKKAEQRAFYVRLKRHGELDQMGLARYYLGGKLYVRSKIYRVNKEQLRALLRTQKFEQLDPELLDDYRAQARQARGPSLQKMHRAKRRQMLQRRRGHSDLVVDDDDDDPVEGVAGAGAEEDLAGEGRSVEV